MTQEDIIRMAREAGAVTGSPAPNAPEIIFTQCLDVERFAALVAAAELEALAQPDAFEQGRQEGMKQERALWTLTKFGQEIEAQPVQEPVAWMYQCTADTSGPVLLLHKTNWAESGTGLWIETPLYTAPQQRPWVGLTSQELADCWDTIPERAMRRVAAKLKEKNT